MASDTPSRSPDPYVLSLLSQARRFKPWAAQPISHTAIQELTLQASKVYESLMGDRPFLSTPASPEYQLITQALTALSSEVDAMLVITADLLLYGPQGSGKTYIANSLLRPTGWRCGARCTLPGSSSRKQPDVAVSPCPLCQQVWRQFNTLACRQGAPLPSLAGDEPTALPVKAHYAPRLQVIEFFADGRKRQLMDHGDPTVQQLFTATTVLRKSCEQTGAARPQYLQLKGPFPALRSLLGSLDSTVGVPASAASPAVGSVSATAKSVAASGAGHVRLNVGIIDFPGIGHDMFDVQLLRDWWPRVIGVLFRTPERAGRGPADPAFLMRMCTALGLPVTLGADRQSHVDMPKLVYVNNDRLKPSGRTAQCTSLRSVLERSWDKVLATATHAMTAPTPAAAAALSLAQPSPLGLAASIAAAASDSPASTHSQAVAFDVGAAPGDDTAGLYAQRRLHRRATSETRLSITLPPLDTSTQEDAVPFHTTPSVAHVRHVVAQHLGVAVFYNPIARVHRVTTTSGSFDSSPSLSPSLSRSLSPRLSPRLPPAWSPYDSHLHPADSLEEQLQREIAPHLESYMVSRAMRRIHGISTFLQASLTQAAMNNTSASRMAAAAVAAPRTNNPGLRRRRAVLDGLLVRWVHQHVHRHLKRANAQLAYTPPTASDTPGLAVIPDGTAARAGIMVTAIQAAVAARAAQRAMPSPPAIGARTAPALPASQDASRDTAALVKAAVRALVEPLQECVRQWAAAVVVWYRDELIGAVLDTGCRAVRSQCSMREDEAERVIGRVKEALGTIADATAELLQSDLPKLVKEWAQRALSQHQSSYRALLMPALLQQASPRPVASPTVPVPGTVAPPQAAALRPAELAATLVRMVTTVDSPNSTDCSCLTARVKLITMSTCDAAFRYQLPALMSGVKFGTHLAQSERDVLRRYAKAIRQQAFYMMQRPRASLGEPVPQGPGLLGEPASRTAKHAALLRPLPGATRRQGTGRRSAAPSVAAGAAGAGAGATAATLADHRRKASGESARRLPKPPSLLSPSLQERETARSSLFAAAMAAYNGGDSGSDAESSGDEDVLAGPHLLRNVSRVDIFDPDVDISSSDVVVAGDGARGAASPGDMPGSAKNGTQSSTTQSGRQDGGQGASSASPARPSAAYTRCRIGGCHRRTKREDGLCPQHAEVARALEEAGDVTRRDVLLEARVDGVEPGISPVRFRIRMLHWNFADNELYEWTLNKTFADFRELRRRVLADTGTSMPGLQLPPQELHQTAEEEVIWATSSCAPLTKFACGLLKHLCTTPSVVRFFEIRPGRVDHMQRKRARHSHTRGDSRRSAGAGGSKGGAGAGTGASATGSKARKGRARATTSVESSSSLAKTFPGDTSGARATAATAAAGARPSASPRMKKGRDDGSLRRSTATRRDDGGLRSSTAARRSAGSRQVVVTLGGPLNSDTTLGVWVRERIEAGVALFQRATKKHGHKSTYLVLTGGDCAGHGIAEAEVMRKEAVAMGVPPSLILTDCQAKDTIQNALLVVPLLIRLGIERVSVVTSEFHVRRSKHYFETILAAYGNPFSVRYVGVEDHMARAARSLRDRKETLLTARSQNLLDEATAQVRAARAKNRGLGRFSWSFSELDTRDLDM